MPADHSIALREAVVVALREAPAMTALVPADRIYGRWQDEDAAYPFTRYGVPILTPFLASCADGMSADVTLHAYADGPDESEADTIGKAFVTVLDGAVLDIGGGHMAHLRWTGGQTMADPVERDIWHAWRTFAVDAP